MLKEAKSENEELQERERTAMKEQLEVRELCFGHVGHGCDIGEDWRA